MSPDIQWYQRLALLSLQRLATIYPLSSTSAAAPFRGYPCWENGKAGTHGSAWVVEKPPAHGSSPAASMPDPTAVSAGCHAQPKSDMNSVCSSSRLAWPNPSSESCEAPVSIPCCIGPPPEGGSVSVVELGFALFGAEDVAAFSGACLSGIDLRAMRNMDKGFST